MLDQEMVAVPMTGPQRMAVVGARAYFEQRGKPKHPRDLLSHDCINYRQISSRNIYRWEFTEQGRDFSIAVNGRIIANDLGLMIRAAVGGHGLAYVLESAVTGELKAKQLVRVLDGFCPEFPGFYLYYPARRHLPAKLSAFVEFFRRQPGMGSARGQSANITL
jgi:DNA-binding transcriptional LysR family regulator